MSTSTTAIKTTALRGDASSDTSAPGNARRGKAAVQPVRRKLPRNPRYVCARPPSGWLFYVRRIPQEVLDAESAPTKAQQSVRIALHTKDYLAAQVKARQITAELDRDWAAIRLKHTQTASVAADAQALRQLRPDDIPVLAQRLEAMLVYADEQDRSTTLTEAEFENYAAQLEAHRKDLRRANQLNNVSAVADDALGILDVEGLSCDETSPLWPQWLHAVLQAHLSALNAITRRLDGETLQTPEPLPAVRSEDDIDDLDLALEYWRAKTGPQPKTIVEMRSCVARFKAFTGRTRISAVAPQDVVSFMQQERQRTSSRGGPVNVQTVNKSLALLKALFALVHGDLLAARKVDNPLAHVKKFRVRARDVMRRQQFSEEQLTTLFSGPVHTAGARSTGGAGEAAYWMPILGYATGARMQEILQLRVADVVTIDGVVMLRTETQDEPDDDQTPEDDAMGTLKAAPQRSLKTAESYRFIPVHRDVLNLGFMAYVDWLRQAGHSQLFPDVRIGAHDSWSANFSKFFNRYLAQLGVKARGLDWISFRHGFKTQTRSLPELKPDIADYIQGHTADHRSSKDYGDYPPEVLSFSMALMRFPALSVVQPWQPPKVRSSTCA